MIWALVGVGAVVVLGIAAYLFLFDRRSPVQVMDQEDGQDPTKRWARACYSIVNGKHDPAANGQAGCRMVLERDWSIRGKDDFLSTFDRLKGIPSQNAAWDLVRAIVLCRFAAGAGLVSQEESFSMIRSVREPLARAYSSWADLAAAYGAGRSQSGGPVSEDEDDDQLEMMRPHAEALWAVVPLH